MGILRKVKEYIHQWIRVFGYYGLYVWGKFRHTAMAYCYAVPSASHSNPQLQSMCMVRSPKSIAGSVGTTLGNAPYKIAYCYAVPSASHYSLLPRSLAKRHLTVKLGCGRFGAIFCHNSSVNNAYSN